MERESTQYSMADQPARFAKGKAENNKRMLELESMYSPDSVRGKVAVVTGGNRGLGLAIAKELVAVGADVIITTRSPATVEGTTCIPGIDVTDNNAGVKLAEAIQKTGKKVDILINNAGYFYGPVEKLDSLNFEEELKMIDICALGPLRLTSGIVNADLFSSEARVAMITSQGGSIAWRSTQNPNGYDYGHHMSKAAANMMGVLVAQELRAKGIRVCMLHPGFNKTDMTKKYEDIWEVEGAVDSAVGAKRVVHEVDQMTAESSGHFINCEDGLEIPW